MAFISCLTASAYASVTRAKAVSESINRAVTFGYAPSCFAKHFYAKLEVVGGSDDVVTHFCEVFGSPDVADRRLAGAIYYKRSE